MHTHRTGDTAITEPSYPDLSQDPRFSGKVTIIKKLEKRRCILRDSTRDATPYTLHPTPYTQHPTPYTLLPTPDTPRRTPYTLLPTRYTILPTS